MPSKLRKAVKGSGKILGAAASFVPGGAAVKAGLGLAGKLLGGAKGGATRKRRFSIARMQKRLIQAKISAKIQRTRLSAFKGL